jgi:hypothetical protein
MSKIVSKEELYDAFGELLYAICAIDGEVQIEEAKKIESLLTGHEGAEEMMWSFEYEFDKHKTVAESCTKALAICELYGPCPDYAFLINALKQVAASSNGIQEKENSLIATFEAELNSINKRKIQ